MGSELWTKWDGQHDTPDQKKRIDKAYLADNTPLSVSTEDCAGKFQGSSGRYETTLEDCTCVDFKRRKLPCKHMYRLAIELGCFGDKSQAKNDQLARKVPKDERNEFIIKLISKIENYGEDEQKEIQRILLEKLYHQTDSVIYADGSIIENALRDKVLGGRPCYAHFIKKMRKAELLDVIAQQGDTLPPGCKLKKDIETWMICRESKYGPLLFPNCREAWIGGELSQFPLVVYKYLHRKFDEDAHQECVWDESGKMTVIEKGFPDDFETGLLNLFGTNPLVADVDNLKGE